jgi:hypothetical protein
MTPNPRTWLALLFAGAALAAIAPPAVANELTDAQRAALQPLAIFDGTCGAWAAPAGRRPASCPGNEAGNGYVKQALFAAALVAAFI